MSTQNLLILGVIGGAIWYFSKERTVIVAPAGHPRYFWQTEQSYHYGHESPTDPIDLSEFNTDSTEGLERALEHSRKAFYRDKIRAGHAHMEAEISMVSHGTKDTSNFHTEPQDIAFSE